MLRLHFSGSDFSSFLFLKQLHRLVPEDMMTISAALCSLLHVCRKLQSAVIISAANHSAAAPQ